MTWSFATIVLVQRGEWGAVPDRQSRRRVFQWCAEAGFQAVEISPRWLDIRCLSNTDLSEVRRELTELGLVVSGLNVNRVILTRTEQQTANQSLVRRAIEAAAVLKASIVNISLSMPELPTRDRSPLRGDSVPEAERQLCAQRLAELANWAQQYGVQLSLELHDDGLLDTPRHCLAMLDKLHLPNVGVNPDLGNFCRMPGEPADWQLALQTLAPRANCWHVKNYRGSTPAPLWDGDIDYRRAFAIMRLAGYDGWVSIESYFGNVLQLQQQSLAYLKAISTDREPSGTERVTR